MKTVCSLGIVALLAGSLLSVEGQCREARTAAQKILVVPGCAFTTANNTVGFTNTGGNFFITSGGPQYVRAPVYLTGGTVKQIVMTCMDNDATWDVRCWFHETSIDYSTSSPLAEVASTGASSQWRSFTTATKLKLNTAKYFYMLNVRINQAANGSSAIGQIRIHYTDK